MDDKQVSEKIRNYPILLLNKGFQLKYTFFILGLTTIMATLFSCLFYKTETEKSKLLALGNDQLQSVLAGQDQSLLIYLVVFILIQFICVLLLGVYQTHKIAGPIHRFENHLSDLLRGNIKGPLKGARKKDEFQSFFSTIAGLYDVYVDQKNSINDSIDKLERLSQHETLEADAKKELNEAILLLKESQEAKEV